MTALARKPIYFLQLGRVTYERAHRLQQLLSAGLLQSSAYRLKNFEQPACPSNLLLLLEHPPTYTFGRRTSAFSLLKDHDGQARSEEEEYAMTKQKLASLGAQVVKSDRGGLITFHGPGQLVGYPILDLNTLKKDMKWYVCALEKSLIALLHDHYGLPATRNDDVGVWINHARKIAAIGFKSSRWITSHGFSLNVGNDLAWYDPIIPCGLKNKEVTTLKQELLQKGPALPNIGIESVIVPQLLPCIEKQFEAPVLPLSCHFPRLHQSILEFTASGDDHLGRSILDHFPENPHE